MGPQKCSKGHGLILMDKVALFEEDEDELQNAVIAIERYNDKDLQRYTKMT